MSTIEQLIQSKQEDVAVHKYIEYQRTSGSYTVGNIIRELKLKLEYKSGYFTSDYHVYSVVLGNIIVPKHVREFETPDFYDRLMNGVKTLGFCCVFRRRDYGDTLRLILHVGLEHSLITRMFGHGCPDDRLCNRDSYLNDFKETQRCKTIYHNM
jgi:hypothetical protein